MLLLRTSSPQRERNAECPHRCLAAPHAQSSRILSIFQWTCHHQMALQRSDAFPWFLRSFQQICIAAAHPRSLRQTSCGMSHHGCQTHCSAARSPQCSLQLRVATYEDRRDCLCATLTGQRKAVNQAVWSGLFQRRALGYRPTENLTDSLFLHRPSGSPRTSPECHQHQSHKW